MPSRPHPMTRFRILPPFSRSASSPINCFLISYSFEIISMRSSTAGRFPPIVMSSLCTDATTCSPLTGTWPHARARDPTRQFEPADRRRKVLLPLLRGVARAVQNVSQQSALVLIARVVTLWRQLDEHSPSRWRLEEQVPRLSPWQFLTARLSAPPAAASRLEILALRVSCSPSRPTSRARCVLCRSPPILS